MAEDWPFDDADTNDPLAALRIPVVRNPYPSWKYEVCLVINSADSAEISAWEGPRPDDREVKQILAELDYRMDWYNAGWQAKMRRRPLDVDSSTNTVVLLKRPDGGWCYRRASWKTGPAMVPARGEIWTLEQVLDHDHASAGGKWAAHKAKYPDAFGEVRSGA